MMLEQLKFSWRIFLKSSHMVVSHKKLMVFPAVAVAVSLAGFLVAVGIGTAVVMRSPEEIDNLLTSWQSWGCLGSWLLICWGIVAFSYFCSVAFYHEVFNLFDGRPIEIGRGFAVACSLWRTICLWALFKVTVDAIFDLLSRASDSKVHNFFMANITDISWRAATCFVLPAMLRQRQSANPFTLIASSAGLLKKTWGIGLGGFIGFKALLFIAAAGWLGVIMAVCSVYEIHQTPLVLTYGAVAVGIAFLIFLIVAFYVNLTQRVYIAGLFAYATGKKIDDIYDQAELAEPFSRKVRGGEYPSVSGF